MAAFSIASTRCCLPPRRSTSTSGADVKHLAILGSTGSIGRSALAVVDAHPSRLRVIALAAADNVTLLAEQCGRYRPAVAALATPAAVDRLRAACPDASLRLGAGPEGL